MTIKFSDDKTYGRFTWLVKQIGERVVNMSQLKMQENLHSAALSKM